MLDVLGKTKNSTEKDNNKNNVYFYQKFNEDNSDFDRNINDPVIQSDRIEFSTEYTLFLLQNFQEMNEFEDWNLKVDYSQIRVWIAYKGSFLNSFLPFLHSQITLDSEYPFKKIIEAVNDSSAKQIWDSNIKFIEIQKSLSLYEEIYRTVYHKVDHKFQERDFIEK